METLPAARADAELGVPVCGVKKLRSPIKLEFSEIVDDLNNIPNVQVRQDSIGVASGGWLALKFII
jgi:hypothetical protein